MIMLPVVGEISLQDGGVVTLRTLKLHLWVASLDVFQKVRFGFANVLTVKARVRHFQVSSFHVRLHVLHISNNQLATLWALVHHYP